MPPPTQRWYDNASDGFQCDRCGTRGPHSLFEHCKRHTVVLRQSVDDGWYITLLTCSECKYRALRQARRSVGEYEAKETWAGSRWRIGFGPKYVVIECLSLDEALACIPVLLDWTRIDMEVYK